MQRMRALKDVPNNVCLIVAGQEFIELDEQQVKYWVDTGTAEIIASVKAPVSKSVGAVVIEVPPTTVDAIKKSPRAWNGLDWSGLTAVIMASGPSLSKEQCDIVKLWRESSALSRVMVVNTTFKMAPWADVIYGCDARWWKIYGEEVVETCTGQRWSQDEQMKTLGVTGVNLIHSERGPGLNKSYDRINQGNNSGYQAINLVYLAGVKKIILLGFDMKDSIDLTTGKPLTHWHGDHPKQPYNLQVKANYSLWIENFKALANDLRKAGVDVVNCTPKTALPHFKKMSLEEALK